MTMLLPHVLVACIFALESIALAPSGPWDAFNLAPSSRTVYPVKINRSSGHVVNADALVTQSGTTTLSGNYSYVTLDFGKEVGGLTSLTFDKVSSTSTISLSFTESPLFIRPYASDDSGDGDYTTRFDGVESIPAPLSVGYWTQPIEKLRGGFRYLTIVSNADAPVSFSNVSCYLTFSPDLENLQDYSGYFYAKDPVSEDEDFLTKVWYSGAYTVQTDIIPYTQGRGRPPNNSGWLNNHTLGSFGPSVLSDGAKRDRAIWPGDMGISVPTAFVSTNDLNPTRNSLSTLFLYQNPVTGSLPYLGEPDATGESETYHLWTLIGVYNYVLYTGDFDWLSNIWTNYTKGVAYIAGQVDSSGFANFSAGNQDWGRQGMGGYNSEGNALYYRALVTGALLATWRNDSSLASAYTHNATALKTRFNEAFWDAEQGMYVDNTTTTLAAEDGNSLAILFNLTDSQERANNVSQGLTKYWNDIGSVTPELPDMIAPFIGGFEIQAHFAAGNDDLAMDLLRREWGYMLYTNISVQSTLLEGYTSNGSLYYRSQFGYFYDPSYTSHSHGWSTGPNSALTFYVLGLNPITPQGQTWSVAPHLSGLSAAQGGFETPLGWFGVNWTFNNQTSSTATTSQVFTLKITTPKNTSGTVTFPFVGSKITVNGKQINANGSTLLKLDGGSHTIAVTK